MDQVQFTDAALMASIRNDDAAAFKLLYDKYWEDLYLKACRRVDKDEAKDMVQEVMTTLWRRRKDITTQPDGNIGRYLHTAVKYRVISHYAYNSNEIRNSGLFEVLSGQPFSHSLETKELNEFLEKEIGRLPARMQQIFRLSRQDDFSIADIADQLNLSEQTVKNQLTEALKRIRASVKLHDSGDWAFILFLLYCSAH
ncbi:MAG: sigma-70 family RNA polymerase sigma factor [Candidatus Pseudobacter hemicellulosilyticus]|uniref:Sigma-70 family RNA polymerase sigma factor n=1 Tax=Candidatus Pseudobacter hemicellulosilyticus TaxID=3121375 RepID=A0AAJ5WSV4_9BACT|nr:MAG: sigma-70 family RNA polymerase sigma factor [Pseudobacter sp.]